MGILGNETILTALVGGVVILVQFVPSNLSRKAIALIVTRDDAHDETTVQDPSHRSLKFSEMINVSEHALTGRSDDWCGEGERTR